MSAKIRKKGNTPDTLKCSAGNREMEIMKALRILLITFVAAGILLTTASCTAISRNEVTGTLLVENKSDEDTIYFIYISKPNENSWGKDILEDNVIAPDESRVLTLPPGAYDIQLANFFNLELDSYFNRKVTAGETTTITYY
jgi:hypothetical protein